MILLHDEYDVRDGILGKTCHADNGKSHDEEFADPTHADTH
jgi:hypothetical protein